MKKIIVLLILFSFYFASHWEKPLDSTIGTAPIIFSGNIVVGTYDGSIYSLDADSGAKIWKKIGLGGAIFGIEEFKGRLLVALENGTIYLVKNYGEIEDQEELGTQFYGMEINDGIAYISTKKGIVSYDGDKLEWIYEEEDSYSPPTIYQNKIIVGKGDNLIALNMNGKIIWSTELGPFWNSKPVAYAGMIYIGSMNHYFYGVSSTNGKIEWMYGTEGAITASGIIQGGNIYFGSNDGYLYVVSAADGSLEWKGKTNGGIFSTPELTNIGQEEVIVIGSSDSYVYGFKKGTGELIWGYPTIKPISKITVYDYNIFVVSGHYLYHVPTDRSCIITEPPDRTKIGYKEIEVKGTIFSEYGGAGALISVNDGPWEKVSIDENGTFIYNLNPNNYAFGSVGVECKVTDNSGQSGTSTTLTLIRSTEFEKPKLKLQYPLTVNKGNEVTVYVLDEEDEELLSNFNYELNGKSYVGNESISLTAGSEDIEITFSKVGYEEKTIIISVQDDYSLYILGGIVLLLAVFFVWFKFIRKPPGVE